MATIRSIAIILISMALILNVANSEAVDCTSLVLSMADCLSFVTAGSKTSQPAGTCCSGLKSVLKTDAQCLCEAFKNSAQFGVILNVTKALSLPSACHVSAPSVNNCGLVNIAPAPTKAATSPSAAVGVAPSPSPASSAKVVSPAPAPAISVSSSHCLSAGSGSFAVAIIASLIFYSFRE